MKYFITTILIFNLTINFSISEDNEYFQIDYINLIAKKKVKTQLGILVTEKKFFRVEK